MPRHLNEKVRRATCGNWRIEQGECRRRERRKRDVEANIPRPLYRHWVDDPSSDSPTKRLQIDEEALKQRRRLSFGSGDGMLSPDLPRESSAAIGTSMPRGENAQPPRERCHLLDLPAEIRHLIWEYAVGHRMIHIFYGTGVGYTEESRSTVPRLSCVECVHRPSPNGWENLMPCIPSCPDCGVAWDTLAGFMGKVRWYNTPAPNWDVLPPVDKRGGCGIERPNIEWRPLALVRTCRQIYSEAIDILYNTSTFRFPQTQSLIQRMAGDEQPKPIEDFIATVLPQRLERITRVSTGVCFPWFEALNDVVTRNLPSLRYLELRARLLGTRGNDTGSNTDALSQLVIGVQSRVPGARVVLRADLDERVPPRLGSQLPQELEVVITPDKAWERSGKWFPMV
ncbi:hypothetical protein F4808DRAFT_445292 [Astrocystis sublimbata]|nr:hypothetical protein F4808DRAFT_446688 [Astrocystis sublimbata]KAI0187637.1 hypothetical protein F4808DRAFT_446646 [Astrocystis sublimbata]KAI0189674.1 hypothetical protein F4808DRAFT_445287 [Astrocystis sublimbata]KAI0189677.1 hypothetical protein F4808DRAFT_445292 [Astrocystis sublimbata]